MGSIYNEWIDNEQYLQDWIQCTKTVCACGSDMQSPKVKNREDIPKIANLKFDEFNLVNQVADPDILFCGAFTDYKLVIWELGRRCNYDCWYCIPASHNNFEGHKTLGTLMSGLENLNRHWSKDQKIKFVFTGGEPTFNPDFLKFATYLHDDLFHIVHTTTNGSHTPDYYSKLMQVSDIGFSAHLSYLERPEIYKKFIKNIAVASESKQSNKTANLNWLGVRIMLESGRLDLAKKIYNDCKVITDSITIDLIHGKNKQILPYSQEEIDWVTEINGK